MLAACGGDDDSAGSSSSNSGGNGAGGGGGSTPIPPKCDTPADAPYVDPLVHLGRAAGSTFIEVLDVVHNHPYVYACSSVQGLNVWDAGADGPPTVLQAAIDPTNNPYPHCQHVNLDKEANRLAFTNRGDELNPIPFIWVADISNPAAPAFVAGWEGPESIDGVELVGDRIWAAAHGAGIVVFDVTGSGLGGITEVARFSDPDSDAWQPLKHGDYLLVAEGPIGLRSYDISGPTPQLVATVPIDGSSKDLVVHKDIAYVAASSRIAAIDVSDPTMPVLVGEIETQGTALQVAIGLNETLLVAEWDKLRGYDINDPANIVPELSEVMPKSQPNDAFTRILTVDAAPEFNRVYPGEWKGMHSYAQTPCGVGPDLDVSPDSLQFGVVNAGGLDVRALILRNDGNRPLQIANIAASAPSMTINTPTLAIAAGEAEAVEVTFTPANPVEVKASVVIDSDDLDQDPFNLGVSGNVAGVDVGDPLPTFSLQDTDGVTWTNADLAGKVAVMAYFATF